MKKLYYGESIMLDNQLHTSPTIDSLPAARGMLLATVISSFFWLVIGAVAIVLL
jgi:hypothetical protein